MNLSYNLTELIIAMSNSGWILKSMSFNPAEWNEFGYYKCPDYIHISVKVIKDNLIIRKDFRGNKIYKVAWNDLYNYFTFLVPDKQILFKVNKAKEKLQSISEDFED